jgi:hypothetical protein
MSGKCPKCEKLITYVNISDVDVKSGGQNDWRGISYNCPYCGTILSVAIDPIALKGDIVDEIKGKKPGY